ncbi:MAG: PDZ domain-containing protein, partial [Planctomycetota bacterium]
RGQSGGGQRNGGMGIRLPEGTQQQFRPHVGNRQLGNLGIVDSIEVPTRPRPGIGNGELPGLIPGGRPELKPFDPPGFDRPVRPGPNPGTVRPGNGTIDIPGLRPGNRPGVRPDWQCNQDEHCNGNTPHHEIVDRCRNVRRNLRLHWTFDRWCTYYRNECHWWFNYCGPTYYFDPTCSIVHNWYYYPCQTYVHGVYHYYKWHLGINAVYIPGRGLGIQEVEVGSPAYYAGMRPGMIILATNGVSLIDETVFPRIVEQSTCGNLSLSVIADASGQVYTVNVRMQKIVLTGSNY